MTYRELMQQVYQYLTGEAVRNKTTDKHIAELISEWLAQPEQEPVAWECKAGGLKPLTQAQYDNQTDNIKRHYSRIPHRKWQGLTDYEINNFDLPESGTVTIRKFVQIIEAKLKEKNT